MRSRVISIAAFGAVLSGIFVCYLLIDTSSADSTSESMPEAVGDIRESGSMAPGESAIQLGPVEHVPFSAGIPNRISENAHASEAINVMVVDDGGEPIPAAQLTWLDDQGSFIAGASAWTDELGRATFLATVVISPWILVQSSCSLPSVHQVRAGVGNEVEIRLGPRILAGRVVTNTPSGLLPDRLSVESLQPGQPGLPGAMARALADHGIWRSRLQIPVELDGSFRLLGGHPTSHVVVKALGAFYRIDGKDVPRAAEWTIPIGSLNLDLHVGQSGGFKGVFEAPNPEVEVDGHGIEEGIKPVVLRWSFEDDRGRGEHGQMHVESGAPFFLPFGGSTPSQAIFRFSFVEEQVALAEFVRRGPFEGVVDLGVIRPEDKGRMLSVIVTDSRRRPIDGALVRVDGGAVFRTESSGWADIKLPPRDVTLRVGAFGFEVHECRISKERQELVEVGLLPSNRLKVQVENLERADAVAGLLLDLRIRQPLRERSLDYEENFSSVHGPSPSGMSVSDESTEWAFRMTPSGTLELSDMPALQAFRWALKDGHGHQLASGRTSLSRGEIRTLTIPIRAPALMISGVIRDEQSQPIRGVRVCVGGTPFSTKERSDVNGEFSLSNVYKTQVTVDMYHPEFVPQRVRVDSTSSPLAITLQRGVIREFLLMTREDSPVDAPLEILLSDGSVHGTKRLGPGLYRSYPIPLQEQYRLRIGAPPGQSTILASGAMKRTKVIWNP